MEASDANEQSIREFMVRAKQYVKIPKLTPKLLRATEVYEKVVKYSHTCKNSIVIYYKIQMKKLEMLTVMFGTYDENAGEDIPA